MALETLKGLSSINGYRLNYGSEDHGEFIVVDTAENMVSFRLQDGPVKESGVNGCSVDTLLVTARHIIDGLNQKFPTRWNDVAVASINDALRALTERTKDRERRGVEGYNKQ